MNTLRTIQIGSTTLLGAALLAAVFNLNFNSQVLASSTVKDNEKIGICHATGSKTNPYVYIVVSTNSIKDSHGHAGHEKDVIGAKSEKDCPKDANTSPAPSATPSPIPTGKVGICHATGSETNPYVFVTVSDNATKDGHSGHNKDVIGAKSLNDCPKTETHTTATPTPSPKASSTPTPTPASSNHATPTPSPKGEVLGESNPKVVSQANNGVATLPKTGLPVAGLAIAALAPFGYKLRRSAKKEAEIKSASGFWSKRQLNKDN